MSNQTFPRVYGALSWNTRLLPLFETGVQESKSGREITTSFRQYPRWQIVLKYVLLRDDPAARDEDGKTALEKLVSFFGDMRGAGDDFLFNLSDVTGNPADSQVFGQPIGTGDGATTRFQLVRRVKGILEMCQEPLGQEAAVYVDGVPKTQGTDYTVASGVVVFGFAPASSAVITADYTALWRARFLTPDAPSRRSQGASELELSQFLQNLYECQQVSLITKRS